MVLLKTLLTLLSPLLLLPGVYSVQFLGNHTALEEVAGRKIAASSCPQAAPHVNATAIFLAACKQNPQNSIKKCVRQLNGYANTSTTSTCQHYYTVLNACLIQYNNNQTACADATTGYQDCGDITLQAYAYCGCYFNMPDDISRCANVQLGIGLHIVPAPDDPTAAAPAAPVFGTTEAPSTVTVTTTAISQVTSIVTTTFSTRATSTLTTTFTSPVTSVVTSLYTSPVTTVITTINGAGAAVTTTRTATSEVTTTFTTTYTSGATATVTTTYTSGAAATITTTYLGPVTVTITTTDGSGIAGTVTTTAYSQVTNTMTTTAYVTFLSTITLCGAGVSSCPPESISTKTVTTTAVSTYISCYGGCTSMAGPTFLPPPPSPPTQQSTSTHISQYLTTKTFTITSGSSIYLSTATELATVTSYYCPGGCTHGTAAAPAQTVCVKRKRPIKVLKKKDEI